MASPGNRGGGSPVEYAVTEVHVGTERGRFAARAVGNPGGRIVIAVHGFADHPASFDDLGRHLAGHGFVTVAPYLRGHAPSPLDGELGYRSWAKDLAAVLQELSPEQPAFVVGHGEGAWIVDHLLGESDGGGLVGGAVALGSAHPATVLRAMKLHPGTAWSMRHLSLPQLGSWARRKVERDHFAYLAALRRRWSPAHDLDKADLDLIRDMYVASSARPMELLRMRDLAALTEQASPAPVLTVLGDDDGACSPRVVIGRHRGGNSRSEVRVLPGVGHYPHLEAPETTHQLVAEWFETSTVSPVL